MNRSWDRKLSNKQSIPLRRFGIHSLSSLMLLGCCWVVAAYWYFSSSNWIIGGVVLLKCWKFILIDYVLLIESRLMLLNSQYSIFIFCLSFEDTVFIAVFQSFTWRWYFFKEGYIVSSFEVLGIGSVKYLGS